MDKNPIAKVEYCEGLCINPESVKTDALRLMAYSNSIVSLRNRGAACTVTNSNLDRNIFTEILSLVVTLSLRCRLWNDNYRRNIDLQEVENSVVGVRKNGSKRGKKIKLREATSFIAHASGFWFEPVVITENSTGINIGISVPHDNQRVRKLNEAVDLISSKLSDCNLGENDEEVVSKVLSNIKLDNEGKKSEESDRVYSINLDNFACGVCLVVDHCHSCAGEAGLIELDEHGLPDKSTMVYSSSIEE